MHNYSCTQHYQHVMPYLLYRRIPLGVVLVKQPLSSVGDGRVLVRISEGQLDPVEPHQDLKTRMRAR